MNRLIDWTEEMLSYLTENYPQVPTRIIAEHLGVHRKTVSAKAIELGISKGVKKDLLNRAEQITELFYDHSYSEIASILGISARTVSRTVATLGLKRSKSQDSSIRSRIRHDIIRRDKRRITFGFPQITRIKVSGYRPKTRIRHQLKKHGYIVTRGLDVVYYTTDFERNHIKEQKAQRFGLRFEPLSIRHKECINL